MIGPHFTVQWDTTCMDPSPEVGLVCETTSMYDAYILAWTLNVQRASVTFNMPVQEKNATCREHC